MQDHIYHDGLTVGMRVQLHPRLDDWMRGDRYGEVVRTFTGPISGVPVARVRLDVSGRIRSYSQDDLTPVAS